jgi:protocatechuate 3,4-dioxygenase beta subunit
MKTKNLLFFILLCFFAQTTMGQATTEQVNAIRNRLSKGEITISQVLSDNSLTSLHSLTHFREIIRENAKAEKLNIIASNEPGTRIHVKGTVLDKSGNPEADKLVYVYQTSAEGWYSDTAPHILKNEGDRRHARLFGYLRTDSNGNFELSTIKPKGYPNSALPAHIHIEIFVNESHPFISELLFEDDPRLAGEIKSRALQEKFIVAKNSGTNTNPLYAYVIKITD